MADITNLSYTNKDFQTIFPELLDYIKKVTLKWDPSISNESDPGVVLLKAMALLTDKLNYNIDKNVLECFPESVTQIKNAWTLFDQLGYSMHWYQSAQTKVSVKWIGETPAEAVTIPRFSKICDNETKVIFCTTDPISISTSNQSTISSVNAIEGNINQVSINGKTSLTIENLDNENRIYFSDLNVAENGVFINNIGYDNFADWIKVDNLYIQPFNKKCYKFGVDIASNRCFIQFTNNIANIIGEGIEIHYVRSSGYSGNIKPYLLTQFYDSTVNGIDISSNNISLTNPSAGSGGADVETIDDAYKNYKKTANICNTLITYEDFSNYLQVSNLISNCVVSDVSNDLYTSINVMCIDVNGIEYRESINLLDDSIPFEDGKLDPFCIRITSLKDIDVDDNINRDKFTKSFELDYKLKTVTLNAGTDSEATYTNFYPPEYVELYLSDVKHIGISYSPLYSSSLSQDTNDFIFENLFNVDITILPTYKLSESEITLVKENILKALYLNFNAKSINFGQEITYEEVFDVIVKSDTRIKTLIMSPITYKLYGQTVAELASSSNPREEQILPIKFEVDD